MYIQKRSLRFAGFFIFLMVCLVVFSGKLILIQFFRASHLAAIAAQQHDHIINLEPVRGTIYDRHLRPLALNISVKSLFANPRKMSEQDKIKAATELAGILNLDQQFIRDRLNREKYFVWLERKLSPEATEQIQALKIPGLDFIKESKRNYPHQYLAAHVIGFAGVDNMGLEGLELAFNDYLKGEPGWSRILRDARQRDLMLEKDYSPPRDGLSLVLTIDENIQFMAEKALEEAFLRSKSTGASLIILDPRTGEVLAMANRPTYDLSQFWLGEISSRTNRAVAYTFEPGSVFKIVTVTAALEEGAFKEEDKIFCENGQYRVANHILHDHKAHGTLTFQGVFEQSSNIGVTKVAQRLGPALVYKYAQRFGFGRLTGIDLLGEVPGSLKPPSQWSKTTIGAIPIGHEVAVTPLQMVCAMAAVANDGVMMKPYVVKYIKDNNDVLIKANEPHPVERVMTEETARRVKAILTGVVERGTGQRAKIDGVAVAGKTGTAQKVVNGQYSHSQFFATFIGFTPVENPRLAAVVMFDNPHPDHFGGTVAAPVFQKVIFQALKYIEAKEINQPPVTALRVP